jgi:PleD family two-component response regulator
MPDSVKMVQASASARDAAGVLAASEQQLQTALDLRTALRQIAMLLAHTARLQEEVIRLRQANARVRELAFHDELTGLPNRTLLQDRFSQAIALARRRGRQIALLFLDLDHFKRINDEFGHVA